jgi:hypothetical protein
VLILNHILNSNPFTHNFLIMIISLLLLITVLLLLVSIKINRSVFNPLTMYLVYWNLLLFISVFNPFGLFPVSVFTYFLLLLNVIAFSLGFLIFSSLKINKRSLIYYSPKKSIFPRLILFIDIFLMFYFFYYFYRFEIILNSMEITDARSIRFEIGLLFRNYTELLVYNYIVSALFYFIILIRIASFFSKKIIRKSFFITIINVYLFSSIGLNRLLYYDVFLFVFITFILTNTNFSFFSSKIFRVLKFRNLIIFSVIILFLYLIINNTALRYGIEILNIEILSQWLEFTFRQFVVYMIGSFRTFDIFILNDTLSTRIPRFFLASFSGLEEILLNIPLFLDFEILSTNSIISDITIEQVIIGYNNLYFNAFYTGLLNFYIDIGFIGIILYPFILGAFVSIKWKIYKINKDIYSLMILIFLVKISLSYSQRWEFGFPEVWIILFFLILIEKNSRISTKY